MPDLLLEIGCEEIPARMIDGASLELRTRVLRLLEREALPPKEAIGYFDTPRRLAVIAPGIPASQPEVEEEVFGPSLRVAYKDGAPTKAAEAFARKVGLALSNIKTVSTPKGDYLMALVRKPGRPASEILAERLPEEIAAISWPKSMYWREKSQRFVRPIRWLVALLDKEVIPLEFAGVRAGSESRGHRILANRAVRIEGVREYVQSLVKAYVLTSAERAARIRQQLDNAAYAASGARWREDAALLATVVNLTEFPTVILGNFDSEFLSLPEEVLVTVMRDHQKYFAVEDAQGRLAPHFLAVLNTEGDPQGLIRHGHERVLRARFNDARFFWDTDQKIPLRQRVGLLAAVTFHKELGSYYAKAERLAALSNELAADLAVAGLEVDREATNEAAWLSKTDLTTELVKEFTELQGIVGGLYARAQGAAARVADAIYDHYKPQAMDEAPPRTLEGAVVSLADKADNIAGMFALGLQPSGSRDPFGLRRAANGMVKTIVECRLPLSLDRLFSNALETYGSLEAAQKLPIADLRGALAAFMRERVEFYLREGRKPGFAYDVVNAVLASGHDNVVDALARAEAISRVRGDKDFDSVCAAFTRIRGILRQAEEKKLRAAGAFAYNQSDPPQQQDLAVHAEAIRRKFERKQAERDYAGALRFLSRLRPHIDAFFDKVMVMVEDEEVRANRLALLEKLRASFSSVADFSEIVIGNR